MNKSLERVVVRHSRNSTIDAMRGVGIFLVVVGHVGLLPDFLKSLIYGFHMPFFFILSGYLFNEKKHTSLAWKQFFRARFNRLCIPAIVIGLSCAIPSIYFGQTDSLDLFFRRLVGVLYPIPSKTSTFNCTPIWFLYCLFSVEIIYFTLSKYCRKWRLLVVLVLFVVGVLIGVHVDLSFPYELDVAFVAVLFYWLGHQVRINEKVLAVSSLVKSIFPNSQIPKFPNSQIPKFSLVVAFSCIFRAHYGSVFELSKSRHGE
jgi:fucose 4-O-acetylase-like acetyltransferase